MKSIKGMIVYNKHCKLWVAMSLEFGLAAQADTEQEVKQKLIAQIKEYIEEASSIDKAQQVYLLNRRAPFVWYIRYYWTAFKDSLRHNQHSLIEYQPNSDYAKHA